MAIFTEGPVPDFSGQIVGLDVETTYMTEKGQFDPDFRVRLVQFGTESDAWVLRTEDQTEDILRVLNNQTIRFCSHTAMDVLSVYAFFGIDITERNIDTRVLASLAYTEKNTKRDLKTLTQDLLGSELGRAQDGLQKKFKNMYPGRKNSQQKLIDEYGWANIPEDDPDYVLYAGLDAIACRQLLPILIKETGAPQELLNKELWLASRANQMQIRGALLDLETAQRINEEATTIVDDAQERAMEITDGAKLNSPKRIVPWLEEHGVDWDSWEHLTKTGNPSVSKEHAPLLHDYPLDDAGKQVVDLLIEYKSGLDVSKKTAEMLRLVDLSGRLHPVLNTVGASATARMSSKAPNIQNFSKEDPRLRGCFVPEPGHTFVSIDFDQIELRVVAGLARERKMIDVILSGGDLHQLTVDEIREGGITIDRATGKMTNFLIVYGGGGRALHEQAGIPLELAKKIVWTWRDRYQAVQELTNRLSQHEDYVRTISGRRLAVKRFGDEVASYANINYVVQSSARDLLVDAWFRFENTFGRYGMVWYPVHDELVLQVPDNILAEVCADAEEAMAMDFLGVPIRATASVLRDDQGVSRWGK